MKINQNKGMTLIEVIVALGVFSVVMSVSVNLFIYELKGQRRSSAMQIVQNNSRYAMELISKEVRMSHIEADSAEDTLHITAYKISGSVDVIYTLAGGIIFRESNGGGPVAITSNQANISRLKFYINDKASPPAIVTIAMTAESLGVKVEQKSKINLQTTISARDY